MAVTRLKIGERITAGRQSIDGPLRKKLEVKFKEAQDLSDAKAKFKIELVFSRHRSSLPHKPSPFCMVIWESGKRFHGGGDQKMYWCGYEDCRKPMSSDNFAYMHVVCPYCKREQFLGPDSRKPHYDALRKEGRRTDDLARLPDVIGEMFFNMTPPATADLLVRTWYSLGASADVYLKWSPFELHYDPLHETTKTRDQLERVRVSREPAIYHLKNIIADLGSGTSLKSRFLALLTS